METIYLDGTSLTFDQVYDIIAFRIILETVKDCYEALGIIHSLWKPVPGRFKDYIGMPKANGYQSLHTTVIGPYGEGVEIQIRTEEMNRTAEEGIAAHWQYKEGKVFDPKDTRQFAWVRQLLEWQQDLRDPIPGPVAPSGVDGMPRSPTVAGAAQELARSRDEY